MKRNVFVISSRPFCVSPSAREARGPSWVFAARRGGICEQEMPKDGDSNLLLQGWIKQGVDWAKWERFDAQHVRHPALPGRLEEARLQQLGRTRSRDLARGVLAEGSRSARSAIEYIWDRFFDARVHRSEGRHLHELVRRGGTSRNTTRAVACRPGRRRAAIRTASAESIAATSCCGP